MSNYIQKAAEHAFKAFSTRNKGILTHDNLSELRQCVNRITKTELNLTPALLEDRILPENAPPVTYMRILEDQVMTVAMFILRPGKRLPLHDHPKMHGFLKVVHGEVKIQTYTPLDPGQYEVPEALTNDLIRKFNRRIPIYPMRFDSCRTVSETDDCCVLSPDGQNIHEISSDGTAAFLDILSPPYSSQRDSSDERPCSYYKEIHQDSEDSSIRYLVKISAPSDYWCDEEPYTGPPLPTSQQFT